MWFCGRVHGVSGEVYWGVGELWQEVWGCGGRCREVCWGVGMSKERCVGNGEVWAGVWESVWGEWGSVLV